MGKMATKLISLVKKCRMVSWINLNTWLNESRVYLYIKYPYFPSKPHLRKQRLSKVSMVLTNRGTFWKGLVWFRPQLECIICTFLMYCMPGLTAANTISTESTSVFSRKYSIKEICGSKLFYKSPPVPWNSKEAYGLLCYTLQSYSKATYKQLQCYKKKTCISDYISKRV